MPVQARQVLVMPHVEGLRSPYDKTLGGVHYLGRMLDKIRLRLADKLPEHFHRNYGLSIGMDGQLCGFLNVKFEDVVAKVQAGVPDPEIVEWIFSTGLRPNRMQIYVWNEHSRKNGWNDRITPYISGLKQEPEYQGFTAVTAFDLIELSEGRDPPPMKS